MSRSPDRRRLAVPAAATAATLIFVTAGTALADPQDNAPVRNVAGPVRNIVAPVLDIEFGTADLHREARVEKKPKRVRVTLDSTVLFAKDSAKIRPQARGRLSDVAAELKQQGPGSLTIVGYTDDLGTKAHGLVLSRKRARAVAAVLRTYLPESQYRYQVTGKGEADPAVPNTSEANRKVNRRVVITYRGR